jgi:hypothetical protein
MPTRKRYRCRWCGASFNAWLPWVKAPNAALLLGHLSQEHMDELRPYLVRMETEDIAPVVVELFELAGS